MNFRRYVSSIALRWLIVVGGISLVILAFLADWVGIGDAEKFGRIQLFLSIIGVCTLIFGLLLRPDDLISLRSFGMRITNLYKGATLLILNTILMIVLAETVAWAVNRRLDKADSPDKPPIPRPVREWEANYWRDLTLSAGAQYYPYTVWRNHPYQGRTIHISENGLREIPGTNCAEDAYQVFTFGGSAMWGWGSPDWGTIPAYLQSGLAGKLDQPICVINYAQKGFVSSQELIELIIQIQQGNIPDLVIFYDGFNDIIVAQYDNTVPNPHLQQREIGIGFEQPVFSLALDSNLFQLTNRLLSTSVNLSDEKETSRQVIRNLLGNYEIVSALSETYGFDYRFFLQPVVFLGSKPLSPFEQTITSKERPEFYSLYREVYAGLKREATGFPRFYSLENLFDHTEAQIYLDSVHIFPEGNEIVATEMLALVFEK